MKLSLSCLRLITFLGILFIPVLGNAQGNTWVAKASFGGTARQFATGFSIGTKVYIGTGTSDNGASGLNDFWEYNTANNTWTQKANFGGGNRYGAVGFTINGKGYIGLGASDGTTLFKDIWEYDPTGNTWTQRTDMGGAARIGAVAFVVSNKAYVGTGQTATGVSQDFWEFDPAVGGAGGTWTAKANFSGVARSFAAAFAIGTKGYLGTGSDAGDNALADFWEYNPSGNSWTQKANFGGSARFSAVGFSIDPKGYIATGGDVSSVNDCWKYDPTNNTWTQTNSVGSNARLNAVGIALGSKGYIGTGVEIDNVTNGVTKNFFEYLALTDQTITFNSLSSKTFGDANFSLTATASSALAVSYVSSNTAVATISGSTVTIVGAGTTTITASQAGDGTYAAAPSVDQTLTVAKANQTITFNVLTGKTYGDAPFGLGASTTSPLTVSYSSSNTSVATVSGSTVTIVGAGTTTITASQAGNANYNAATSVDQSLSIAKANQTITFGALANKSVGDAPFGLTASINSGLTINFSSSNTAVATVSGATVTIVGEGSTTITASQSGDANHNAAADVPQNLTITDTRATQTITFGTLPAKTFGDASFSVTPTSSSSLAVTVTSSNTAVATVNGSNQVTIVGAGTTTLTASQAGNGSFKPATPVDQTLTVAKANQIPDFYIPPTATVGMGIGIGPSTSAGLPVTVTSSDTNVATVAPGAGGSWFFSVKGAGTTTITISQAGNDNYNPVSQSADMVVSKGSQTITFNALAAKTFGDAPFSLIAYSSVNLTVSFTSSDPSIAEVNDITKLVTIKKAGTVQITANQSGSGNYSAATPVVQDLVINKANQTITFPALDDQATGNPPFAIVASTTSQLPLSFTSSNTAVATVSGNQITIVGVGTTTLTATQAGDENYNAATSVDRTLVVKPGQKITFDALPPKVLGDPSFTISATASSGLTVSFSSTNTAVASVSGNTITINGVGSTVIVASQAGDGTVVKAKDVSRILVVKNIIQTASEQGQLWGVTRDNGAANLGSIFKTNADGTGYTVVKEFKSELNGAFPDGTLTLASNGKLYGITREGGSKYGGVLFEYDPATGTYTKKFDFGSFTYPAKELIASANGKLYGVTPYGLADHDGSYIYEYDIASNSISQKSTLSGVGTYPTSNIILTGGKIYGTVYSDYTYQASNFFEYDIATNTVAKKATIELANGGASNNKGIVLAANGKIYGTSDSGGANGVGAIFEFDIINNAVTKKFDFDYYPNGSRPVGLMSASNGKLYGMTKEGGLYAAGTIYEFDPSSSTYAKKYDFTINYVHPEGRPWGRLMEAPNGKFYGSGTPSTPGGSIFEFDLVAGTVSPKVYQTFENGHAIFGSLCLANNKIYGLASQGGVNNAGVLFEYDFSNGAYTKKVEFGYASEGARPVAGLTQASNGKLYGVTSLGGANNYGVIFEVDPATNSFTKRADIEIAMGNYIDAGLLLGLNGKLYGSSMYGSQYNSGAIFEFDPATFQLKQVVSLDYGKGSSPRSRLIQTEDQKLWGLASLGGANSTGTLFDVDLQTSTLTKHADFTGTDGSTPLGGLVLASNGKFYGHTSKGGANNMGVVFEYDVNTNTKTVKYDFSSANGDGPIGSMISVNGKLYGTTYQGGANNGGVLFEYDPSTSTYTKKYDFSYATGSNPKGGLLLAANGNIYGLTSNSNLGRGILFEYNLATNAYTPRYELANYNSIGQEISVLIQTLTSSKKEQTITFGTIAAHTIGEAAFSISATSSSSLAVKFSTTSDKITLTDASVTILKAGKVIINADQAGDSDYNPAPQAQQTFCINPGKPTITVTNENTDNVKLNSSATTGNQWFLNGVAITNATDATYSVKEAGVYAVQTAVDGCMSELSANFPVIVTGDLLSNDTSSLMFYPNPAEDKLMISIPENTGSQINIYHLDGRSVKAFASGEPVVEVDVRDFITGAYVVRINTNASKNYVGKFIKK